jgi:hypothetical protein
MAGGAAGRMERAEGPSGSMKLDLARENGDDCQGQRIKNGNPIPIIARRYATHIAAMNRMS